MLAKVAKQSRRRSKPRKRIQLGLIVTAEIRERVAVAAEASGRTLSQEAERLIERGVAVDDMLAGMNITIEEIAIAQEIAKGNIESALEKAGYVPVDHDGRKAWVHEPDLKKQAREIIERIAQDTAAEIDQ